MADPVPQQRPEGAGALPASPRHKLPAHKVDLIVAAIILALCAFLFWETTNFREIPRGLAQNVPPERFPQLLLIVIAAMALFIPFEHVHKRRQGIDLDKERSDRIRPITFMTALALFVVVLVTPWLGTLPAMVLACALIPLLWGERRFWLIAIYAIALPLAVALLFVGGLEVNFLPGIVGHLFR
jgi:putative tricarboxylic transport membrane protein